MIKKLNNRANIFVVQILPTKNQEFNRRALYFNSLIFRDLEQAGLGVTRVVGLDDFVDDNGLLSERVSKRYDRFGRLDMLHLNESGSRQFAMMIKKAVFTRLNRGADKRRRSTRTPGGGRRSTQFNAASLPGQDGCQV